MSDELPVHCHFFWKLWKQEYWSVVGENMFVSSFYEVELLWLWALVENDRLQKYVNGSITNSIIFITNIIPVSTESQLFYNIQYFSTFSTLPRKILSTLSMIVFSSALSLIVGVFAARRGAYIYKKKKITELICYFGFVINARIIFRKIIRKSWFYSHSHST